jgi:uncharacterized protein YecT (DUF1311 family)
MRSVLFVIGLMSVSTSALAQNIPPKEIPTTIRVDCKNQKTQFDLNFCANQKARAADRKLNQAYQRLLNRFKGTRREPQIVAAQTAWLKFRDANCEFSRDRYEGGSIAPMIYVNCIEKMSLDRTKQLEDQGKEGEGVL